LNIGYFQAADKSISFIFTFLMNIIIMNKFINRKKELLFLKDRYGSGKAELILIYGRRRIGKTYLIRKFMEGIKRKVYVIVKRPGKNSLRDFSETLEGLMGFSPRLEEFSDLYRLLKDLSSNRLLFVIDEFQRLAEQDQSFLMEMQAAWDQYLSKSKIMLILMGSSVGAVERVGISPSSPIYGRTGVMKLGPFRFSCARKFLQEYSDEDQVRAYSIFGGTPAYLDMLDPSSKLEENVMSLILGRGAPLKEEPIFLLAQETREPLRYMTILEAIASGATTLGEIASKSDMKVTDLPRYLSVLEKELDVVGREYPLLEKPRRGKTRYRMKDEFFRFWFRFVHPNWDFLEMGEEKKVLKIIIRELDVHTSLTFEEIAKEHFLRSQDVEKVGRWWKGDVEIDLVGLRSNPPTSIFTEVKWTSKPVGREVLNSLISKASLFNWKKGEREEKYVIYSRSGFTFNSDEAELIDLRRLMEELDCVD